MIFLRRWSLGGWNMSWCVNWVVWCVGINYSAFLTPKIPNISRFYVKLNFNCALFIPEIHISKPNLEILINEGTRNELVIHIPVFKTLRYWTINSSQLDNSERKSLQLFNKDNCFHIYCRIDGRNEILLLSIVISNINVVWVDFASKYHS